MTEQAVTAYLGLGANLGDREASISAVLRGLHNPPIIRVTAVSSLYETVPVGVTGQPDYLNAVVEVQTGLTAQALLTDILNLEKKIGRTRNKRWEPRVIDIDVLLYGDQEIATLELTVPHPRLTERAFALVPLAEIAPDARFPDGETAKKKCRNCWREGTFRLWESSFGKAGIARRFKLLWITWETGEAARYARLLKSDDLFI